MEPLPDFDSSLVEGGTKGPRKSRRQRRFEKKLWTLRTEQGALSSEKMWKVPENISVLQREHEDL